MQTAEKSDRPPSFAVASDYSEIVPTEDGFGKFPTELEAVEHWIGLLEGEREITAERLTRAKRRLRALKSKPIAQPSPGES